MSAVATATTVGETWAAGPARRRRRWTRFILPLIMPGILAGALMAFALSIDDFVTSNFVSGAATPFPVWVYARPGSAFHPRFSFSARLFSQSAFFAPSPAS